MLKRSARFLEACRSGNLLVYQKDSNFGNLIAESYIFMFEIIMFLYLMRYTDLTDIDGFLWWFLIKFKQTKLKDEQSKKN